MFAAINEGAPEGVELGLTGENVEAAESRVVVSYENALLLLQRQETDAAQVPPVWSLSLRALEVAMQRGICAECAPGALNTTSDDTRKEHRCCLRLALKLQTCSSRAYEQ